MATYMDIRKQADEVFDKAEALEIAANKQDEAASAARYKADQDYKAAREQAEAIANDARMKVKEAANLYRQYDRLMAQSEQMERDERELERSGGRSAVQTAQRRLEDKMLGVPMAVRAIDPIDKELQIRQNKIDQIMKNAQISIDDVRRAYERNELDCEDMIDPDECRQDNIEAASSDIQNIVDVTKTKLKPLGIDNFLHELEIPNSFDINE